MSDLPDDLRQRLADLAAGRAFAPADPASRPSRSGAARAVVRAQSQTVGFGYLVGIDDREDPAHRRPVRSWVAKWFG